MFLNNFFLKIIAIIAMTLDHLGLFLSVTGVIGFDSPIYIALRIVGRLAFPIFIYLLYEGCTHTSNIKKYMLRLGIMATIMMIICMGTAFITDGAIGVLGNVFLTLFLLVFMYYIVIINKKKALYPLAAIPPLWLIGSFIYELCAEDIPRLALKILDGFVAQYSLFGIVLFILVILIMFIYKKVAMKAINNDEKVYDEFTKTKRFQINKNIIMSISIVITSAICYLLNYLLTPDVQWSQYVIESYMVLAIIPIMFYNGKPGFKNKIVQGGMYLYYPLHLGIMALIFYICGLL